MLTPKPARAGRRRVLAVLAAVTLTLAGAVAATAPTAALADPPPYLTNCMPQLVTCGYPTFESTGVDPETELTPYEGVLFTEANNQVIEDLDIDGCIVVQHTGVVISNVKIHGDCFGGINVDNGASYTASHVSVSCEDGVDTGINLKNATVDHAFVERCENAVATFDNVILTDSLLMAYEGQPGISHGDLVQVFEGSNVVIDHNTLANINPMTSAIIADIDDVDDFEITDNFLMGGSYSLYCPHTTTGFTVTGNRFYPVAESPGADRRSPAFGMVVYCDGDVDIVWSDNRSDFDGSTVNADGSLS